MAQAEILCRKKQEIRYVSLVFEYILLRLKIEQQAL